MKKFQRLAIALAVAALIVVAIGFAVVKSERSLVTIENRSNTTLSLSVETTNPGQFAWDGSLAPRQRVIRTAQFGDNSLVIVCRDEAGIHRTTGGYVTNGLPQRVQIVANGCASVSIDVRTVP